LWYDLVSMETTASNANRLAPAPPLPDCPWRRVLAEAVRDPAELCRLLRLPASLAATAQSAASRFGLLVPRPYLARIRPGDPMDPLLLQVLPRREECVAVPGFSADPVGDAEATWGPGLLRKYRQRILMVTTPACAVHCRFCFRRHYPYRDGVCHRNQWGPAFARLAADSSIHEVILSGGDPLMLDDDSLAGLVRGLAKIPHLTRLRLHTRLPIMIPQRVTHDLLHGLRATRLTPLVVLHINHPAEIDTSVASALGRLVDAGISLLSQTVLLRAVNDRLDVLAALFERLADLRVMPYYLHQLDPVAGAAHFEVSVATGCNLINALRTRLPGYAVPRYVRETPGGLSKQVLA
jgi:EF-P beta-lysylation protein EpmB